VGIVNASALLSLEQSQRTIAAIARYLESLDAVTQLVALGLLAELHSPFHGNGSDPAHPLLESVRVTADGLHRYAAVQANRELQAGSGYGFAPQMESLRQASFVPTDFNHGPDDPVIPAARLRRGDRLFDIVGVKEWDNPGDWATSRISWLVRAGQWAYWSMNETGRVLLCRIAAACLTHQDHVNISLTLRLGCHLGFRSLSGTNGGRHSASIGEILAEAGEHPAAADNGTYRRFNSVLFSLCNMGVLTEVTWPPEYRFDGFADGGDLAGWLDSRIKLRAMTVPKPREGQPPHRAFDQLKI